MASEAYTTNIKSVGGGGGGVNTLLLCNNRGCPASSNHCTNLQQKMFQPVFSVLGLLHGSWHQAPSHRSNVAEASYPHYFVPSSPWWCSYSLQIRRLSPCCCVHYLCKYSHIKITMHYTSNTSIIRTCSVPILKNWFLWAIFRCAIPVVLYIQINIQNK